MELDVSTSEANVHVDGVETVEVIAGGEDGVGLGSSSAAATLMDQHMAAVANPQEILVPTSEVSWLCAKGGDKKKVGTEV